MDNLNLRELGERVFADGFFDCLKYQDGPSFTFSRRAGEAPDFVYVNGEDELQVEVTTAYCNNVQPQFLREVAYKPELALVCVGNQDEALANSVVERVQEKRLNRYGEKTILLIEVPSGQVSVENLKKLLAEKVFPPLPFLGVYVSGWFPIMDIRPGVLSLGGYHVLAIKETWPLRRADKWIPYKNS